MTLSTGPTDRLIGRQRELALLRQLLADARAGSGHLVVVSGPAGMGKTRLIEELLADAGATACWGAAIADAGMPALWPWLRALRGLPGPFAAVTALADGTAQHGHITADESAAITFAADTTALDALTEQAATDPGLVVVLDDLQWADQATLRLLERVAAEIRRLPILVVGGYRDAGTTALPESMSHRATEVIGLGPLSATESAAVLTASVADADHTAVRRAAQLSGGSPLYLRTLARVATDQLRGQAAWGSAVGEQPELRHLVSAAVQAAGPDAAELVSALSVLGDETEPELLAGLVDAGSASAVVEGLLPAVPAGLVEIPASGPVRFAHALVRDATYALLRPARRTALHRKAAELLEPLAGDHLAGVVARHWQRAGEPGPAATWAIRAADGAAAAGAYDEAAQHLALALDAIGRHDADPAELLLDLARVQHLGGQLQESAETCARAADDGERTGRPEVVCRAAITVQGIGHPEINHLIHDLCRRALAALGPGTPAALRARVEAQLSCALHQMGETDEAVRWSRVALEDAVHSGDANAELDASGPERQRSGGPGSTRRCSRSGAGRSSSPTPAADRWQGCGRTCGVPMPRSTSATCPPPGERSMPSGRWPIARASRSSDGTCCAGRRRWPA